MIRLRHSSYLAFDEVLAAAAMPRHTRPGPGDLAAARATLPLARAARELLGLDNEEVQV